MNVALIDAITPRMVAAGHRVLQIHRFAEGERAHVARLERWAEFPAGARVVDLGSGTGEMARIMMVIRPDLRFTLVNLSRAQLAYSPEGAEQLCCDFRAVPLPADSFDAAMFCFSIGHENAADGFREGRRLLRPGGILFIYDMVGEGAGLRALDYFVGSRADMEDAVEGFRLDFYMEPTDNGDYGRAVLGEAAELWAGTKPAVWRFVRC